MKKYLVSFLVGCFIAFIIYLGFSFISVSFDIKNWSFDDRTLCGVLMMCSLFIPFLIFEFDDNKTTKQ